MTRINIVPVEVLTNEHLCAEWKELPRVFTLSQRHFDKTGHLRPNDAPIEYTLGKGHVKFFYDKWQWLVTRLFKLRREMERRGYHPDPGIIESIMSLRTPPGQMLFVEFKQHDYYLNMARLAKRSKDSRVIEELSGK